MKIIKNAIKCRLCGEIIESKHVHNFVGHNCTDDESKGIAADGGLQYLRRVGDRKYWEDVSETINEEK
jgi:hypothetical protein